ncbi:hypothetical protein [Bartonella sp. AU18XJBT]|uniref:hypothetical protein n=1 Tax=Bartonella sp. AU18XJBT TaxID=3019089 RepID=UPI002360E8D4|nr:hypothetical protein [Bartonella sp. AU18XJBT]
MHFKFIFMQENTTGYKKRKPKKENPKKKTQKRKPKKENPKKTLQNRVPIFSIFFSFPNDKITQNTFCSKSAPSIIFASPQCYDSPWHLRRFIRAIFNPFLYSFYPHASPACGVQESDFN